MSVNKEAGQEENQKVVIYQTEDGEAQFDVQLEQETVWLSQAQKVELFDRNKRTISEPIYQTIASLIFVEHFQSWLEK